MEKRVSLPPFSMEKRVDSPRFMRESIGFAF